MVSNFGLPFPRSIATNVLMPTPAKSASVCLLMPNVSRLAFIIFPISSLFTLHCDFAAKYYFFRE